MGSFFYPPRQPFPPRFPYFSLQYLFIFTITTSELSLVTPENRVVITSFELAVNENVCKKAYTKLSPCPPPMLRACEQMLGYVIIFIISQIINFVKVETAITKGVNIMTRIYATKSKKFVTESTFATIYRTKRKLVHQVRNFKCIHLPAQR